MDAISKAVKDSDEVLLATDPDREGEAIAWHIAEILNSKKLIYETYDSLPILSLRKVPLQDSVNMFFKRLIDIVISLSVIVFILSWLTPIIALFIKKEFLKIKNSAKLGKTLSLGVHAGHGLNYQTSKKISQIDEITALNIGHFFISESIFFGIANVLKKFNKILKR